jgi:hypothetical protein
MSRAVPRVEDPDTRMFVVTGGVGVLAGIGATLAIKNNAVRAVLWAGFLFLARWGAPRAASWVPELPQRSATDEKAKALDNAYAQRVRPTVTDPRSGVTTREGTTQVVPAELATANTEALAELTPAQKQRLDECWKEARERFTQLCKSLGIAEPKLTYDVHVARPSLDSSDDYDEPGEPITLAPSFVAKASREKLVHAMLEELIRTELSRNTVRTREGSIVSTQSGLVVTAYNPFRDKRWKSYRRMGLKISLGAGLTNQMFEELLACVANGKIPRKSRNRAELQQMVAYLGKLSPTKRSDFIVALAQAKVEGSFRPLFQFLEADGAVERVLGRKPDETVQPRELTEARKKVWDGLMRLDLLSLAA